MELEEIKKTAALLLTKIDEKDAPANDIINGYTQTHRYIEAEDRKTLLNLIWTATRAKARLGYAYPDKDWLYKLNALENGIPDVSDAPNHIKWEAPEWFLSHIPEPENELPPMMENAPVILRANGKRDSVLEALRSEGLDVSPCRYSPYGIVLNKRCILTDSKAYKKGLIEIQDEGAQLLSLEIGVKPHDDVFDFCAGAGGKSLIFAQIMQNKGFIQAYDASFKRLSELGKRAARAKTTIIKTVTRLPENHKKFDYVVVDAPCSGTGTWRRTPDMRWKLTEKQLQNIVLKQAEILDVAKDYVKPGHFLVYITCSLTYDENEQQVEDFIRKNPRFSIVKERRYSPYRTGTDGFFLCVMQKR